MNLRGAEQVAGGDKPVRMLLIEDDDAWADIVLEKMRSSDPPCEVIRVSDASMTLPALADSWDIVVLDFDLRSMDAAGLLSSIRAREPQLPVIVVAGSFGDEIAVNAMKRGAHDVVLKHNVRRLLPAIVQGLRDAARRRVTRELQERHRATWEQTAVGIAHGTLEGKIIVVNETFGRMVGRDEASLQGRRFVDITHPDDVHLTSEKIGRLLAGESSVSVEKRYLRPDGELVWVLATFTLARDEAGTEPYVIGIIQDISARKTAETRLRENERRTRELMEAASDAIFIADESLAVVDVNLAGCEMTGYSRDDILRKRLDDLIVTKGTVSPLATLRAGEAVVVECGARRKDGATVPVEISARLLSDGRAQAFVRDITPRREAQALARQWQRQAEEAARLSGLGRLAATMAHEFNNVLMGIQPFAELIRRKVAGDTKLQQAASHIQTSIRRGKRITGEILSFTQTSTPIPSRIDSSEWLPSLQNELQSMVSACELVLELPEPPIILWADQTQLAQALANVVLNARDAMPRGGRIRVTVDPASRITGLHPEWAGALAGITVTDEGPGIPPEVQQRMFEPLFTTRKGGTGLGLALTHQIVTRNGGHIVVESSDEGTSVHLLLPRIEGGSPSGAAGHPGNAGRPEGRRVLIVEDDEAVALGMAAILDLDGFPTHIVRTGGEAEGAIRSFEPNVVILDIGLPDIDGIELFCDLSERYPDIRYIIATGHATRARVEGIKVAGGTALLQKPFEMSALIQVMEELDRSG